MKIIITESQYRLLMEQIGNYDLPKEKPPIKDKTNTYVNIPDIVQQIRDYEIKKCSDKFNDKTLGEAKNWWIKWLNDPKTKEKFMTNRNLDDKNVEILIKKYINSLKIIQLIYCPGNCSDKEGSLAHVDTSLPSDIVISCTNINNGSYSNTPIEILIHEIQHSLSALVGPLHSESEINKIFGNINYNIDNNVSNIKNLKDYGVSDKGIEIWKLIWLNKNGGKAKKILSDPYICDTNEISSRVMSLRKKYNLKPGEELTIKHILPFLSNPFEIKDNDLWSLLLCWIKNGLRDINDFLKDLNQLAVNNKKIDTNLT